MKTDKLLQLIQQKRVMRSGGALPLPKAQSGIQQQLINQALRQNQIKRDATVLAPKNLQQQAVAKDIGTYGSEEKAAQAKAIKKIQANPNPGGTLRSPKVLDPDYEYYNPAQNEYRDDKTISPKGSLRGNVQQNLNDYNQFISNSTSVLQNLSGPLRGVGVVESFLSDAFINGPIQSGVNMANTFVGDRPIRGNQDFVNLGWDAINVFPLVKSLQKGVNSVYRPIIDSQAMVPLRYRSKIADIKKTHREFFDLAKTEEGRRRLKTIGVNPEDFTSEPKLTFRLDNSTSYMPEFITSKFKENSTRKNGVININFKELEKAREDFGYDAFDHISSYDHELGHWLGEQSTIKRPAYKKALIEWKKDQVTKEVLEQKWNSLTDAEKELPENQRLLYRLAFTKRLAPNSVQPTSIDLAAGLLDPSFDKLQGTIYDLEDAVGAGYEPYVGSADGVYNYFNNGFGDDLFSVERFPHIREMKRNMVNNGVIQNIYEPVTNKQVFDFIKANEGLAPDRISKFADTRPHSIQLLTNILNDAPMVTVPLIGAGVVGAGMYGAQGMQQQRNGGSLPKHQGTDKSQTGYNFPWWAVRNPALLLSGFLGSNEENTQPQPVVEKPTRAPFNYDLYNNRASTYLSRPVFEGTPLTGQLIADSARDFYNQTGYEYPLDLLLSQAQFETSMGRKLKSKNNFFNVGNYDDGRTLDYKTPQESLSAYMNLIYNDYLNKGKVPADQLLQPGKFVNTQGKRYASNPNYEKDLSNQSSVIKKTWASDVNKQMNAKKAFGGHIASYQFLGEANEDNNKPKEIKNYVSVPPNTIFPDKAWTSDVIDPNTGMYTMRAETSVPQIFGSTVTALNPKKSSWTQDQNFGANTEGIVEKLELTGDSLGPNLYRETGTKCRKPNGEVVPECASGVQLAMDYGTDFGGENRKKLGITGDAWTMGQNVVDAGGSRYYNLVSNDLDKSSLHSNKQVKNYLEDRKTELGIKPLDVYNSAQAGDLVEMWYEGSPSQSKALREGNGAITTHIGIVSVKDGKKYVTHNIHGHWESNPLEKALRKMNVKHGSAVMVSGLVRPDYMDNSKALETVGVQINPEARVYSGSSEETKRNPKETKWKTKTPLSRESQIFTRNLAYYAPQIQQDFGFSDSEMEELMKTSFGLFGKESGFGEGDKFKKKQKFRKLIGKYKDISPDWDYEGDEMSVGKGQIKMDEVFNTPEKKALLEKYGITKDNIWDTGNSAAALLLTTAMNYKNLSSLLGTTFENTDAITLKNILALSHNKGLETVINNEFISKEGNKRRGVEKLFHLLKGDKNWNNDWDESPTMDATSILEGLRTYSDLHLNPESYSNIFEDYAASLNVNYNKVKENFANKENFKPRTESIPGTIVDAATQGIENVVTGAQNEVESVVNQGERGVRKMARAPRKVISKIKKELRGVPTFEQGGTVRVQPLSDAQRRYFELLINQKNKK